MEEKQLKINVVSLEQLRKDLRGESDDYAPGEREAVSRISEEVAQELQSAKKERWGKCFKILAIIAILAILAMYYWEGVKWITIMVMRLVIGREILGNVLILITLGKCLGVVICSVFLVCEHFRYHKQELYHFRYNIYQDMLVVLCALIMFWLIVLAIEYTDVRVGKFDAIDMFLTTNLTSCVFSMLGMTVGNVSLFMIYANRDEKRALIGRNENQ